MGDQPDPFAWRLDADLSRLMDLLNEGGAARYVGGCVRDSLLGHPPGGAGGTDIDVATTHRPEKVQEILRKARIRTIPTGIEHGTVTAVLKGRPVEVTTLRADVDTDGRHATVRFTEDFGEDARRRDFTINALFLDAAGGLHDPVGGRDDLEARRVRFIGTPDQRIKEDFLRILRFVRFSARFSGELEETGWAACLAARDGLHRLSKERIWHELERTFPAPFAPAVLARAASDGILGAVMDGPVSADRFGLLHRRLAGRITPAAGLAALWPEADEDAIKGAFKPASAVLGAVAAIREAERRLASKAPLHELLYRSGREATMAAIALDPSSEEPALAAARQALVPVLPVRGSDLVALGVPMGPEVGAALRRFEAAWLTASCPMDAATVKHLLEQAAGPAAV